MAKDVATNHELHGWVPVDCPQDDKLRWKPNRQRQEYDDDGPARLGMFQEPGFYQTVAKELRCIPVAMFRTEVMKIIERHELFDPRFALEFETWRWRWWCHLPDLTDHEFSSIQLLDAMIITARRATPALPCCDDIAAVINVLLSLVIFAANFTLQPASFDHKITCSSCNLWNFVFLPIVMSHTSYVLQYSARNFDQLSVKMMQKERLTEAIGDDRTLAELLDSLANELDAMAPETINWALRELPFVSAAHRTRKCPPAYQNVNIDEETLKIFEENPYFQGFYKLLTIPAPPEYSNINCGLHVVQSVVGVAFAYLLTYGIETFEHSPH